MVVLEFLRHLSEATAGKSFDTSATSLLSLDSCLLFEITSNNKENACFCVPTIFVRVFVIRNKYDCM